jgi:hypothetical protein
MGNKIRGWELAYVMFSSSAKAVFWFIPIALSALSISAHVLLSMFTVPSLLTLVALIFIFFGIVNAMFERKIALLKASMNETIELLKQQRQANLGEVVGREARMYPDGGQIALSEYNKLIDNLRSHGYHEFECQEYSNHFNQSEPIQLHLVSPGMSKLFIVGAQPKSGEPAVIFKILGSIGVDARDFAVTWFTQILKILGNASSGISELQDGSFIQGYEVEGDFYVVSKYRYLKRSGIRYFRVYFD